LTLTGGDPLWNKPELLEGLLWHLFYHGFDVSVETSGVVEWERYRNLSSDKLSFVVDYKLSSCGDDIYRKNLFNKKPALSLSMTPDDTVKFVIYSEKEFYLALERYRQIFSRCAAKIAFGVYWDGELTTSRLVMLMKDHCISDKVYLNVQLHKIVYSEMFKTLPSNI